MRANSTPKSTPDPFQTPQAMRRPSPRYWVRRMIAPATVVGFFVIAYYFLVHPCRVHQRWYRAVECRILSLAERRPEDVDAKQWAACLHHTWNLHGNHGGITRISMQESTLPFPWGVRPTTQGHPCRPLNHRLDLGPICSAHQWRQILLRPLPADDRWQIEGGFP